MNGRDFLLQPFSPAGPLPRKDKFEERAGGPVGPPPSPQTPLPNPLYGVGGEGLGEGL